MKSSGHQTQQGERAEPRQANPAVFDREHLSQYTGGDPVLERELLTLFLGHFAPVRTQLEASASPKDWKFASHSLKGSARSIGAPQLAALAERLEIMGFEGPEKGKARALDELDAAMLVFTEEVKKAIG